MLAGLSHTSLRTDRQNETTAREYNSPAIVASASNDSLRSSFIRRTRYIVANYSTVTCHTYGTSVAASLTPH